MRTEQEMMDLIMDVSMKRFEYIHPAAGNEYASVKLMPEEFSKVMYN